jgi:hypothetical protein
MPKVQIGLIMTAGQRYIMIYYDFAEKCDDDIEIMVWALKFANCKKRPSVIRRQLENMDADKKYAQYYASFFQEVTLQDIQSATTHAKLIASRTVALLDLVKE